VTVLGNDASEIAYVWGGPLDDFVAALAEVVA
jgi:hypothetical protein